MQLLIRLGLDLPPASAATIQASLALPTEEQSERNWHVSVSRHTDGKVYATNDVQFAGFSLLWEISFQAVPALTAPRAQTTLLFAFDQERRLLAKNSVRYELTAPLSFRFPNFCLSAAEQQKLSGSLFEQCIGSSNVATMVSNDPSRIKGRQDTLRVELVVILPEEAPLMNHWTIAFFLDTSSVNLGYGETAGFSITSMPVSLKGSNQLSTSATGYFTMRPLRVVEVGSSIHFVPPAGQRYEVSCYQLEKVNLPAMPECSTEEGSSSLVLTLAASDKQGGGQLESGMNYTMGIGITNAGRTIPDAMNRWAVVIYDIAGNIRDANYEVPGQQLRSLRMSVANRVVMEVLPDGEYRATIAITLTHDITAGLVQEFRVTPPSSFSIHADLWKVSAALPVAPAPSIEDGVFVVPLSGLLPHGSHSIQATGTVDVDARSDTTWLFQARRGDEVMYQHVLADSIS